MNDKEPIIGNEPGEVQQDEGQSESDFRRQFSRENHMMTETALCMDSIFNLEKELKQKMLYLTTEYSISKQEGSFIFFAKFTVSKGLVKIERTFLFDIWHSVTGFEENRRYLDNEIKNFRHAISNF